jgi:hypothetical protein
MTCWEKYFLVSALENSFSSDTFLVLPEFPFKYHKLRYFYSSIVLRIPAKSTCNCAHICAHHEEVLTFVGTKTVPNASRK